MASHMVCHIKPGPVGRLWGSISRKLKQTRRRLKRERHLKLSLRVSAIIFQVFKVIMPEKMRFNYPGFKLKPALGTRQNWTFVIIGSRRPHNCKKRVSMGLTVNRQMALKLTVNRQKRNIFTVNRQMSEPKLAVKLLRYPSTIETDWLKKGQLMPLITDRFNISQKCIFVLVSLE